KGLGHRDLHTVDIVAVPDRLEERVTETEVEQILHRLFAKIMVDTKYPWLGEHGQERAVERLRRREVVTKRLLRDDPSISCAARATELLDHGREEAGGNGEIVQRPLCRGERLPETIERRRILVIPIHVPEQRRERAEGGAV